MLAFFPKRLRIALFVAAMLLAQPGLSEHLMAQDQAQAARKDLDADYPFIVKTIETFYQDPTQERLDNVAELFVKHKNKITPQTKVGALGALAIGRASRAFELEINGDADTLDFARVIASGEREEDLFVMLAGGSPDDPRAVNFWRFSFTGTGDEMYLDKLLEIADDYVVVENEAEEKLPLIMNCEATLLNLCKNHPKVLEYMKKALENEKWQAKHAIVKRYIAYSTQGWDRGAGFDRTTAEGTLRLFFLGVIRNNLELVRATSEPTPEQDLKLITSGKLQGSSEARLAKMVAGFEVKRLKAGDTWKVPGGKTEITVTPIEDSDRAMIAYIGPDTEKQIPFQVFQIGGVWWVKPDGLIQVRKAAKKLRESRN